MTSRDPSSWHESADGILQLASHQGAWTLYGHRTQRFRGALGASLLSHAGFVLLIYGLMSLPGARSASETTAPPLVNKALVWLDAAGPGGGGGGGGNRSAEPAHRLQTHGADAMALPVMHATPLTPPREITPQEPPPMALVVPVRPMDSGLFENIGVVAGANAAPTDSHGSGRDGGAGTGRRGGSGGGNGVGLDDGDIAGVGNKTYTVGGNVSSPILIREVRPSYTPDAMRAKIQGEALVAAVVLPDGSVTDLRILRSVDSVFGLDEQALRAVRQWRFKPGMRLGQPVAVQISVSVGFTLR